MESLKCLIQSTTAQIFTEKRKSVQPTTRSDAPKTVLQNIAEDPAKSRQ